MNPGSTRGMARLALGGLLLTALLAASSDAEADETHAAAFPLGERALGMGGAYSAVASDPSAAYYNPGGLAFVPDDALSASLSVHAFDRVRVRNGFGAGPGTADLRWRERPALPIFVGVVQRVGKRDPSGVRRHAFALTTLYPGTRALRFDAELFNPATGVRDTLRVSDEERVVYVGPSWAMRVSERWGLGVSAFMASRRIRHTEDRSIVTEGMRDPVRGTYENATLFVNENLLTRSTRHVVLRLGAIYRPSSRISVGLMVQPPGIELTDSARLRERRSFADTLAAPAYATFFESDNKGLSAASPIPIALRVGGAYTVSDDVMFSADFTFTGASGSAGDPIRSFGDPEPDPETGDVAQPGSFAVQTWHREWTVGGAIGFEAILGGFMPLRLGAYSDLSSAPNVPAASDLYQPAHVDAFGLTGSLGFIRGGYDVSVGVATRFGYGDALGTNPNAGSPEQPEAYVRRDMRERTVLVFFSGAQRAVRRVARQVYREHIRRPRRPAEDAARDPSDGEVETAEPTQDLSDAEAGELEAEDATRDPGEVDTGGAEARDGEGASDE